MELQDLFVVFLSFFLIYCGKIQHYTPEISNTLGSIICACGRQAERTQQRETGKGC